MDFKIVNGDLLITDEYLETVNYEQEKIQLGINCIQSVSHDWHYDNIGCDLERFIGNPLSDFLITELKNSIITRLVKMNVCSSESLYVNTTNVSNEYISLDVYIHSEEASNSYHKIQVHIELSGKVYTKIGDELICLY